MTQSIATLSSVPVWQDFRTPGTQDIVTNSFNSVQKIKFSKYDADGAKHEWTDVAVGQIIDIFQR